MIVDCRTWRNLEPEQVELERKRVFCNGLEVRYVWYVDTDAGIVKSYDVLGDGGPVAVRWQRPTGPRAADWEDADGLWSVTLQGAVTLLPWLAPVVPAAGSGGGGGVV